MTRVVGVGVPLIKGGGSEGAETCLDRSVWFARFPGTSWLLDRWTRLPEAYCVIPQHVKNVQSPLISYARVGSPKP